MRLELQIGKFFFEFMLFYKAFISMYVISIQFRWAGKCFKALHIWRTGKKDNNSYVVYLLNKKFVFKSWKQNE